MNAGRKIICLLGSVLLAGTTVWAQGGGPQPGGPGGRGPGGPGGPGGMASRPMMGQHQPPGQGQDPMHEFLFPPELIMRHQAEIGLSDAQKKAIREEVLAAQGKFTQLQWDMQDVHQALMERVKTDKVDETAAMDLLAKLLQHESELKRQQLSLAIRLKNQLTSDQIAKLREKRPKRPQRPQGERPDTAPSRPQQPPAQ
jgi:hypothetical protein